MCFCDNDDDENSDRILSLRPLESNLLVNEVITGIRVIKMNGIFYLQKQVGRLLPMKQIDQNSVKWVPIVPLTITENLHHVIFH